MRVDETVVMEQEQVIQSPYNCDSKVVGGGGAITVVTLAGLSSSAGLFLLQELNVNITAIIKTTDCTNFIFFIFILISNH